MSGLADTLNQAAAAHRAGTLDKAEPLYRTVIAAEPQNIRALHLLGILEAQRERFAEAEALLRRAINGAPRVAQFHLDHGNVLRALHRRDEALRAYDSALSLDPRLAEAAICRGGVLHELHRPTQALAAYDAALAIAPAHAGALNNRGNVLSELGRPIEALASFDRAIAVAANYPDALSNRGVVLHRLGRHQEAAASFTRALALAPDLARAWIGFSEILPLIEQVDPGQEQLLLQALTRPDLDPQNAMRATLGTLARDPRIAALLDNPDAVDTAIHDGSLLSIPILPLLRALLEDCIVADVRFETLLTTVRRRLLSLAARSDPVLESPLLAELAASLALQCFNTDYAYPETKAEREELAALTARDLPPAHAAIAACYRPLHGLARIPHGSAAKLAQRQIAEPRREAELKASIPALTAIGGDQVSTAVRRQYEENPYPRWRRAMAPGGARPLHDILRELFPLQAIADSAGAPEILIAGCGTGRTAVQAVRRFADARVLAVDLSLASLAYAKRATEDLGIASIEFAQADIIELGGLARRFDIVESSGVLHHLGDPLRGWRVLSGLLRPGGYMCVGLYSRRARRNITTLRDWLRANGYAATPNDIRRARQDIVSGKSGLDLDGVVGVDFFNLSTCRDLLFHAHEHEFSPAEIKGCLKQLDLEFLGFELPSPAVAALYRNRFPADPAMIELANWDALEAEHPDLFIHMYQFWARKPRS